MGEPRMVLVTRKTRLEELVHTYNTVGQARFYIEHLGQDFSDFLAEHDRYKRDADRIMSLLGRQARSIQVDRSLLSTFLFDRDDLVYVFGQDGLVANTLKYLQGQPVIGINPDPGRWAGILLPWNCGSLDRLEPEQVVSRSKGCHVSLGLVTLGDGQELLAVNDFYIGQRSHVSSRYELGFDGRREFQSSSGIIVSTGLGSTGWMKSVLSGATRISAAWHSGGVPVVDDASFPWDADYLRFAVREPYLGPRSACDLVFGDIPSPEVLEVVSGMGDTGVIFSDGMEEDFLAFPGGMTARVGIASRKGLLLKPA